MRTSKAVDLCTADVVITFNHGLMQRIMKLTNTYIAQWRKNATRPRCSSTLSFI